MTVRPKSPKPDLIALCTAAGLGIRAVMTGGTAKYAGARSTRS
ncbi:hypothetical protein ACFQLX_02175 [Streptomyces polyrhachis]|uniref:Uncharacterized protein n=1 Tax=Streptomyces polyrhachis TaxID=1282885 RepID=A0ABW2G8B8_9ACTN